ncbi:MAG: D-tyrosyl-tRNA(Tyr) deacylase [Ignavibacteria bacterium]
MRAVVQRVSEASVTIDGEVRASIGRGYVILVGIRTGDTHEAAIFLAEKCAALRVFEDAEGKMNLSLNDVNGSALVVSQFTLYGNAQKGNRPSFTDAARPEEAEPLYHVFVERLRALLGPERVQTGVFRAMMQIRLINDGPVTILIEGK